MASSGPVTASASFLSIRSYIEAGYGAGTFQRVRQEVRARGFDEFPQVLTPGARHPTAMLTTMVDTAHELLGPADFYERCGRAIVDYEINALFRFALQLSTPMGVLARASDAWRKVHSAGSWTVEGESGRTDARLTGFPTTAGYCRLLTAYFQRLFELTGAREVVMEHPRCVGRGDAYCGFMGRWRV